MHREWERPQSCPVEWKQVPTLCQIVSFNIIRNHGQRLMLCNSEVKNPPPVHGDANIFNIGRGFYLLQNLLESDAVSYHPYRRFERGEQLLGFRIVISTKPYLLDDGAFFQIETSQDRCTAKDTYRCNPAVRRFSSAM